MNRQQAGNKKSKSFVNWMMQFFERYSMVTRIQWMLWPVVFLLMFFSLLPEDSPGQAFVFSLLNTLFYMAVIYGNISWLFPRLYLRQRVVLYVTAVIIYLAAVSLGRAYFMPWIYNRWFTDHPVPVTGLVIFRYLAGVPLLFMLSFVFRIAIAYFSVKQQAAALTLQNTQAALNLLKSQVQPHFLFNTLNNIYYEAYREAPRTALLIERLSEIMRYFVDESPKDQVSLATEVSFLEHYIALEKIRIRHEVTLTFDNQAPEHLSIPPMLLMTFVENIFKHGIDKKSQQNEISIILLSRDGRLEFSTCNTLPEHPAATAGPGSGIWNLRKRLTLLYGEDYLLTTAKSADSFTAFLSFPL